MGLTFTCTVYCRSLAGREESSIVASISTSFSGTHSTALRPLRRAPLRKEEYNNTGDAAARVSDDGTATDEVTSSYTGVTNPSINIDTTDNS